MKRRRGLAVAVVGVISIALVFALAGGAAVGKKKKTVKRFAPDMVGAVDVPPGDPDGSGEASFKLNKTKKKVCFNISFQGIDNPTDGHIHKGDPGVAGAIVVPLFTGTPGLPSPISDCVKARKRVIKQIIKRPGDFYVNIHNDAFPGGALRDQLQKKRGGGSTDGGGGGGGVQY
jgi:CHRD domain